LTAHPEHSLQTKVTQWVREYVPQPHFFTGIDRTKKASAMQHVREKARGLVSGTPDTVLMIGGMTYAVELKAPDNEPTEQQSKVGAAIVASGSRWGWCNSVAGYAALLIGWGVALHDGARDRAARHDAVLTAAATKRKVSKAGKPTWRPKKGAPRFAVGKRVQARAAKAMIRI
jgi:hypothetical protein